MMNYCVISLQFCDFLNSASFAAALVFYLPGVKTEKGKSPEYFKSSKKTQCLMNTL